MTIIYKFFQFQSPFRQFIYGWSSSKQGFMLNLSNCKFCFIPSCFCKRYFGNISLCNLQRKHSTNLQLSTQTVIPKLISTEKLIVRFSSNNAKSTETEDTWKDLDTRNEKEIVIDAIPVKKENIYTIPNLLSCLRIGISPYLGYLIVHQSFIPALIISIFAAVSDLADGHIARKWPSQQSAVGSALDPLADKIFISILAVSLTYVNIIPGVFSESNANGPLMYADTNPGFKETAKFLQLVCNVWKVMSVKTPFKVALTTLFIGRDLLLVASVFYLRYKTCPRPVTLKRYFDPTLVNAKLSPTFISKVNTFLQIAVIWTSLASPIFGFADHILLKGLWGLTACTTIASGVSYITRRDTVRVLSKDKHS